jgi:N-methylhydantoinase B
VEADFSRTDPHCGGCVNAPLAVARAATYYCFACLASEDLPRCEGMFAPIRVIAPAGTLVSAVAPAAVAGGNVETSQRIVDCVLAALAQALPARIPADSAGTMSSLSLGGVDPRTGEPFAYYETIGGGAGAGPLGDGESAVQTHMTNTRNTPAESLEATYPLRVRTYAIRAGSGGAGLHRGGDGIIREIESLADGVTGSLLADRHAHAPAGRWGGDDSAPGAAEIIRAHRGRETLPSKARFSLGRGDRIRVQTPGGGGFGRPGDRPIA